MKTENSNMVPPCSVLSCVSKDFAVPLLLLFLSLLANNLIFWQLPLNPRIASGFSGPSLAHLFIHLFLTWDLHFFFFSVHPLSPLRELRLASGFKIDGVFRFPRVYSPKKVRNTTVSHLLRENWARHLTLNNYNSLGFLRDREKKIFTQGTQDYCGVICRHLN